MHADGSTDKNFTLHRQKAQILFIDDINQSESADETHLLILTRSSIISGLREKTGKVNN
jgi:hypothetical protein